MATRVNYSGFVIAGLGFFLTRFTVTLALYEDPIRFLFAGLIPLMLGLGLAAFGVALAVADVDEGIVRTVAAWAVIGAVTMFVLAVLTLFGSEGGELPALATVRSRAYLSNFLIGGSVGGTFTGLYASRIRRQRRELEQQANRLEVLNRLLRHEVLNALTVIRGYAPGSGGFDRDSASVIQRHADSIEGTIEEVKHLSRGARPDTLRAVGLLGLLEESVDRVGDRHPDVPIELEAPSGELSVRADGQLGLLFERLLEAAIARHPDGAGPISLAVSTVGSRARVRLELPGVELRDRDRALLETGAISTYDDPSSGFDLHITRLLVERYRGETRTIERDGGTELTVELPRGPDADAAVGPLLRVDAGLRPAVPELAVAFVASMIAGVLWGVGSELLGGSVAGIGVFYGTASPAVGWFTHQFHSAVFGFIYVGWLSLLPVERRTSAAWAVGVGLVWSLALWVLAAGVVAPIWLRLLGIPASIPNLTASLFVAHVSWGISLGLLTVVGYRYVMPWFARRWSRSGQPSAI
ncbi:MAG: HAMP domain-containing sensor histidine kinase [Halobacteriales archaeon]|nr:HAMP domain-containing sensor histidine kinase [Halobacteriales archaeon]